VDKIRVEVRKAQVARNLSDEQTMQLFQQNFEHSLDQLIGAAAWVKVPLGQCPLGSAPCASSGRAWWLWAACTPTGRPATASGARASRLQSRPSPRR